MHILLPDSDPITREAIPQTLSVSFFFFFKIITNMFMKVDFILINVNIAETSCEYSYNILQNLLLSRLSLMFWH